MKDEKTKMGTIFIVMSKTVCLGKNEAYVGTVPLSYFNANPNNRQVKLNDNNPNNQNNNNAAGSSVKMVFSQASG